MRIIVFSLLLSITSLEGIIAFVVSSSNEVQLPEIHEDKFYYFGYGSNMLTQRIHIQNPTAVRIGMAELKDYRLDFNTYTRRWDGAPATIVATENSTVFGTLWDIDLTNLPDIDNQEGVSDGIYVAASLPVILPNATILMARAYLLVDQPKRPLTSFDVDVVPFDRQPSKSYLQCLVKGAVETGLPEAYVRWLRGLKHNGRVALDLEQRLELSVVRLQEEDVGKVDGEKEDKEKENGEKEDGEKEDKEEEDGEKEDGGKDDGDEKV